MKGPLDRTKVVIRHLPPTISKSNLAEHINSRFSGRYRWLSFRTGKPSLKHLTHSRAYIDFSRPDDVIEFAEFFNGHVFVNEKGTQFKAIVEYAPSQRVPKQLAKKDGREGTVLKDPEYLGFLEFLAKPVENLPSAEIQLERREAERAGAPKDIPVVTPLMEYVRQKRVAKFGAPNLVEWEVIKKSWWNFIEESCLRYLKKRLRKEKDFNHHGYVSRNNSKGFGDKDNPTYLLVPKHDDKQLTDKSAASVSGADALDGESGGSGSTGIMKKILLLKGNEKETVNVSGGSLLQQNAPITSLNSHISASSRQNQRREPNGRIIRSILINKDARHNQPLPGTQSELGMQASNQDRDERAFRPTSVKSFQKETNGITEDKVINNDVHAVHSEKQERRSKNKDSPDRGVWTPLRRTEESYASDDSLSSSASQTSQLIDSAEGGSRSTGIMKKILLLKGNEKGTPNVCGGSSLQQNAPISPQNSHPASFRQNQQRETNGRVIRSILTNKDAHQNQPLPGSQSELWIQTSNQDRDKRPPRPPSNQSFQKETNGITEDKVINNDVHAVHSVKQERRTKNKNRSDRGVWTPLRRSEGSHGSDDSLSSSASQTSQVIDSAEDVKNEMLVTRGANYMHVESDRNNQYSRENGSYRNGRRRGSAYNLKDTDSSIVVDAKPLKRGGSAENKCGSKSPVLAHSNAVHYCCDDLVN
ncbi:hypothetical protein CASFOL_004535 [Castilleja foliolosa]|uniref:UPF3 domain-containing protein n=1 Tax=Castilleja foliolosa TaxID=1961234 RepID=A0ABD3EAR2_9LAMI